MAAREIPNPKLQTIPKSQILIGVSMVQHHSETGGATVFGDSEFGFVSDFGFPPLADGVQPGNYRTG
jgi:hypothetical protein